MKERADLLVNVTELAEKHNAQPLVKSAGSIVVDGRVVADTQSCCHCGAHWVPIRGSGIRRGFCIRCMHTTCGAPNCDPCIPVELRLLIQADPVRGEHALNAHLLGKTPSR